MYKSKLHLWENDYKCIYNMKILKSHKTYIDHLKFYNAGVMAGLFTIHLILNVLSLLNV